MSWRTKTKAVSFTGHPYEMTDSNLLLLLLLLLPFLKTHKPLKPLHKATYTHLKMIFNHVNRACLVTCTIIFDNRTIPLCYSASFKSLGSLGWFAVHGHFSVIIKTCLHVIYPAHRHYKIIRKISLTRTKKLKRNNYC